MNKQEMLNKIKEHEETLEALKKEIEKLDNHKFERWKPDFHEKYWCINTDNRADWSKFNSDYDKELYETFNCFKTQEEAELEAKKRKLWIDIRLWAAEINGELDWYHYEDIYCTYRIGCNQIYTKRPITKEEVTQIEQFVKRFDELYKR